MLNKLQAAYIEKYQTTIAFLFIISFIVFQPILKYSEYVLNFPRINFSIFIVILFCLYMLTISRNLFRNYSFDLFFAFWILLFITGIQVISTPGALYYGLEGPLHYFKIISKTFFCYWMFWFSGLHIEDIFKHKNARLFFSISWLLSIMMIIQNSLSNEVFNIILDGHLIYLMLGDTFAILSIFTLVYNKKFDLFIIILSIIALFALFSRASLYSFVIVSILYMFKEHKYKLLFLTLILLLVLDQLYIYKDERMFRILFGGFDASRSIREQGYLLGIKDIQLVWPFGYFMGDVKSNYGHPGKYIHSYLSFLRQFGIIPFVAFIILLFRLYSKIFFQWFKNNNLIISLVFYYTSFVIIEIIFARSYMHPFIWLSLSAIPVILMKNNE